MSLPRLVRRIIRCLAVIVHPCSPSPISLSYPRLLALPVRALIFERPAEEELLDEQLVDLSGPAMDLPAGDPVAAPAAAAAAPAPAAASAEDDELAALEAQMAM